MLLKKGDTVKILTGKDRGKKGKVLEVSPRTNRVVVENLNLRTRNVRARRQGEKGQRIQFAAPLHASNVMMVCPKCNRAARLGVQRTKDRLERVCRRCHETL
ncbi:MAG: 50S ribosomal protein L24 [Candidatus Kerfeldbacteria bacterium]|nr:50S ribosomal protein L24 [Candidatus Kerfeldbacteria bacterium]